MVISGDSQQKLEQTCQKKRNKTERTLPEIIEEKDMKRINLKKYDGKCVRITTDFGEVLDGNCEHLSRDFCECEIGIDEECLELVNFVIRKSQIEKIEISIKRNPVSRNVKVQVLFIANILFWKKNCLKLHISFVSHS